MILYIILLKLLKYGNQKTMENYQKDLKFYLIMKQEMALNLKDVENFLKKYSIRI